MGIIIFDAPAVEFDKDANPMATEYTFGPEDQFWAFDFVQSKDGEYIKLAFGACDEGKVFSIVEEVFPTEVAPMAAKEAVQIALEVLQEWMRNTGRDCNMQKESDWICDTFLKDVQNCVDTWNAERMKKENRLN